MPLLHLLEQLVPSRPAPRRLPPAACMPAAPEDGLPSYNDIFARCVAHEGWQVYKSPSADARLMLEGSLSFTIPPNEVRGRCRRCCWWCG